MRQHCRLSAVGLALILLTLETAAWGQSLDRLKAGVVRITSQVEGMRRTGTGFIVGLDSDAAYIVTASHVVEGDSQPRVEFWLPQIIRETITTNPWRIGLVSMIPWGAAAITAIVVGASSDRRQERRWHIATGAAIGAVAVALSGLPGLSGWTGLAFLTVATAGMMSTMTTFWSLPTAILSGNAAAAGIAWINSVGNLSGYVSPFVLGAIRDATRDADHPNGNMFLALSVLAVSLFSAGVLTLVVTRPIVREAGL